MRYTQHRGLAQATNWVKLKSAALNLKKLSRWLWKENAFFSASALASIFARNPVCA